jgi:hypothetical protein
VLALSACDSSHKYETNATVTSTMNLIAQTEAIAPEGVKGTFQFVIKASGVKSGVVYLNTEMDYRDRRNITVTLHSKIISVFTAKYGASPDFYFIDKTIGVTGEIKRVKIYLIANGKRTEKYYYQTQLIVTSLEQVNVIS